MIIPIKKLILESGFSLQSGFARDLGDSFKRYVKSNKTPTLSKGVSKLPEKTNTHSSVDSDIHNMYGFKDNLNSSLGNN